MTKDKKPKNTAIITDEVSSLINVISLLDSYRINRCEDFRWVDNSIKKGKFGQKFRRVWKDARKILCKIARMPSSSRYIVRLMKIREFILFFGFAFPTTFMALSLIYAVSPSSLPWQPFPGFLSFIAILAFAIMLLTIIIPRYIDRKIAIFMEKFYQKDPAKYGNLHAQLKFIVQDLIFHVCRSIECLNHDPTKFRIKLYNIDYGGIRLLKKPSRVRKFYIATPELRKNRERESTN